MNSPRRYQGIRLKALMALGVCLVVGAAQGQVSPPKEDLIAGKRAGPWRRLFLDATVVEEQSGLARVFHPIKKHSANPVMRKDGDWERNGPYLYGTVMWNEGRLRMWYHHQGEGGYWNSYAESTDGVHWDKPDLGMLEYQGSKHNNLIVTRTQDPNEKTPKDNGQCHNPSVIFQPWNPNPQRRYALYCFAYDYYVPRVAFSADGQKWSFPPLVDGKGLFGSGDVVNFFHDPYRERYVATWKTSSRRGRAAGIATSGDGLTWAKPVDGAVMAADDLDPDATQVYGMPVFAYQGLYIGQPWIYNARWPKDGDTSDKKLGPAEKGSPCTMDVQLAWSWDLQHWTRPPERGAFIPRGEKGTFDSDMVCTAIAPVQMGDELYFYYGGFDAPHNATKRNAAIGIGVLRLDGFCSMRAGAKEGSFVSKAETLTIPSVVINAQTHDGGVVSAELLTEDGLVIEGFSRQDCVPFHGDSVRHVLAWKTKAFKPAQADSPKKIRFYLKEADMYSYLPCQTRKPLTVIYDPGQNGGLPPNDPALPKAQRFELRGKPEGYHIVTDGDLKCLDLHSQAGDKTNASCVRSADWDDDTDWCLETWCRIVNQGTEPDYGFAAFMQPPAGRNASLYLSGKAVGIMNTAGAAHKVLRQFPMDTTTGFHWYRLEHAKGKVVLSVDGQAKAEVPFAELGTRGPVSHNVSFGPNASNQEGQMRVAKFGFRLGGSEPLFSPVTP